MKDEIILGLQYGDEGKGKVTLDRLINCDYRCCVRFNGGPNAGHTVYLNGKKFEIHQLPTGCVYGIKSFIGPGCVIDISQLNKEIEYLQKENIQVKDTLFIAENAHIIQESHILDDIKNDKIGSTKKGISYAYSDKYLRKGILAKDSPLKEKFNIVDSYSFINNIKGSILFEGAQGFLLDIDFGHYPFTTSSSCGVSAVFSTGIEFNRISKAKKTGVIKAYETYVGNMEFQGKEESLKEIQKVGKEFGTTTGRQRQCNWLNLDNIIKAIHINGIDEIICNKVDILENVKQFKLIHKNKTATFHSWKDMSNYIETYLDVPVIFSSSPLKI